MKDKIIILLFLFTIVKSVVGQNSFETRNRKRLNEQYTDRYDDGYSKKEKTRAFSDTGLYGQNTFSINGNVYTIHYTADKNWSNPQFTLTRSVTKSNAKSPLSVGVRFKDPTLVAILVG